MNKIKNIRNKDKSTKKINKREITLIIIMMMVILLFFSGYSTGKSLFQTDIKAGSKIAEPILIVDNNSPLINLTSSNNSGSYEFKVRNYDDNQNITQIDLKYNIEVITKLTDYVEIKLYKDNERVEFENCKTQDIYMSKDKKEEHNYRIDVVYNENQDIEINELMQDIQIKVHSEQVRI